MKELDPLQFLPESSDNSFVPPFFLPRVREREGIASEKEDEERGEALQSGARSGARARAPQRGRLPGSIQRHPRQGTTARLDPACAGAVLARGRHRGSPCIEPPPGEDQVGSGGPPPPCHGERFRLLPALLNALQLFLLRPVRQLCRVPAEVGSRDLRPKGPTPQEAIFGNPHHRWFEIGCHRPPVEDPSPPGSGHPPRLPDRALRHLPRLCGPTLVRPRRSGLGVHTGEAGPGDPLPWRSDPRRPPLLHAGALRHPARRWSLWSFPAEEEPEGGRSRAPFQGKKRRSADRGLARRRRSGGKNHALEAHHAEERKKGVRRDHKRAGPPAPERGRRDEAISPALAGRAALLRLEGGFESPPFLSREPQWGSHAGLRGSDGALCFPGCPRAHRPEPPDRCGGSLAEEALSTTGDGIEDSGGGRTRLRSSRGRQPASPQEARLDRHSQDPSLLEGHPGSPAIRFSATPRLLGGTHQVEVAQARPWVQTSTELTWSR